MHDNFAISFQTGEQWRTHTTAGTSKCQRCSTTWSTNYSCAPCGASERRGTRHRPTAEWWIIAARTRAVVWTRRKDAYSRNCSRPAQRRAVMSSNSRSPNEACAFQTLRVVLAQPHSRRSFACIQLGVIPYMICTSLVYRHF